MTWGTGPPLILLRFPRDSNVQEEWGLPELADWYAALGESWRVVRFDHRGCGGSDPSPEPSLDDYLRDLQAVQTATDADPAVVLSPGRTATVALELAARRSGAVSGLALLQPQINLGSQSDSEPYAQIEGLRVSSPSVWHETVALWMGWRERASRDAFVQIGLANDSASVAYGRALRGHSVEEVLPGISVATVVIRLTPSLFPAAPGRDIARAVPGAELVALAGEGQELAFADREGLLTVLEGLRPDRDVTAESSGPDLRIILFTDVEDSTDLVVQHGDAKYRELLADHERLVREALAQHGGNEIKTIGDSFMCWFSSASSALDAAQAMQRKISDHYGNGLRIRIGIHAGEPIQEADGDLYGTSVVRASRIMGQADGGQILVSQVVTDLVEGKGYLFSDAGEFALKGYERAVHLFDVKWEAK